MKDEYQRILNRDRAPDHVQLRVPSWVMRFADRYIGPTNAAWGLGLNAKLLPYARALGDGPPFLVGRSKRRLYYKLRDVVEWAIARRLPLRRDPPPYLTDRYSWPEPPLSGGSDERRRIDGVPEDQEISRRGG